MDILLLFILLGNGNSCIFLGNMSDGGLVDKEKSSILVDSSKRGKLLEA